MFELIKEKADLIQEMLWDIAENEFQIARTNESNLRISSIWKQCLNELLQKNGIAEQVFDPLEKVENVRAEEKLLSLAFMNAARAEYSAEKRKKDALDLLIVAAESLGVIRGIAAIPPKSRQKSAASILASKRHAETRALKDFAVKHWRENINPSLSASKAAEQLLKVVPLSHKKLAELISSEKKKTH